MTKRTRRTHCLGLNAKVVFAAIKGGKTLADQARVFDVHPLPATREKTAPSKPGIEHPA